MSPRLLRFGARRPARKRGRIEDVLRDLEQTIQNDLDLDAVVRGIVASAHRSLRCRRVSAWLTTGHDVPRLAAVAGERIASAAPSLVIACAEEARPQENHLTGGIALAMRAARTGLLGVLLFEGSEWVAEDRASAAAIADRAAAALQAAFLYERALEEKDKTQAILSRTGDAIVVTGPRGDIREWNAAAERTFGDAAPTTIGRRCAEAIRLHRDERALDCRNGCPLLAMAADPAGALGVELWRPRPEDGSRQPLLAGARPVRDASGQISDVVHSFRDITRLKEADQAKTLFLATASHELKTPLTVIQGFANTLSHQELEPEDRRMALEAIERRAVELNRIVDRLLLSSKIEAGRLELQLEDLDPIPLLRERTGSLAAATGREIRLEIEDPLPPVRVDPSALTTVVDHLLDNAIKYSPAGGAVRLRARAGDVVTITVGDEGVGMDAVQAARCFEKFWQAESSNARRFGGTGIGLFIVRSLVEAMGGDVGVVSEPGRGSTFSFSVPRSSPGRLAEPSEPALAAAGVGERSVIREFMRQMGVPVRRES